MKWQIFNKLCKKEHLKKRDIKPVAFDDDSCLKKGLYWEVPMKNFQGQDFYHTFGVPGVFFNGYLPMEEVKDIKPYESDALETPFMEPDTISNNGFAYYDFEIKSEEMFYRILNLTRRIRWNHTADQLELEKPRTV